MLDAVVPGLTATSLLGDGDGPDVVRQRAVGAIVGALLQRQTAIEREWQRALTLIALGSDPSGDAVLLDEIREGRAVEVQVVRPVARELCRGQDVGPLVRPCDARVEPDGTGERVLEGNVLAVGREEDVEEDLALLVLVRGRDTGADLHAVAAQADLGRLIEKLARAAHDDRNRVWAGAASACDAEPAREPGAVILPDGEGIGEGQGGEDQGGAELHFGVW